MDLVVDELTSLETQREAASLLAVVWQVPADRPPLLPEVLRALSHTGNYVAGAWADGRLVGASVAFAAGHSATLHSHITGVLPQAQGGGVGAALKHHQRRWAADHGFERITWTFDPLIRRNARFNLHALGATAVAFHPDFYGPLDEPIDAGDETDRLLASWAVDTDSPTQPWSDGVLVLADDGGRPLAHPPPGPGVPWLVQVPKDVATMRSSDPAAAREWRVALRETLRRAFDEEHLTAVDVTEDGCYVLVGAVAP